jgi:amino acid transporter
VIAVLVLIVAGVAAWGISESLIAAGIITGIEVLGLLFVCVVARDSLSSFPERWTSFVPSPDSAVWAGVLSGAFVAFYAFIGFEDMVNVAEEVKQPERTLPRAIVAALLISTALYMLVAVVATLSLPQDVLAGSAAPLAVIVESRGVSPRTIALVSLFAVINGALIQLIMASPVLYGLGSQGLAWNGCARVHAVRRTPLVATILVAVVILCFALTLSLDRLARLTSFIALGIFAAVNLSLLKLKRKEPFGPEFTVPKVVPIIGALLCAGMLLYQVAAFLKNFDS